MKYTRLLQNSMRYTRALLYNGGLMEKHTAADLAAKLQKEFPKAVKIAYSFIGDRTKELDAYELNGAEIASEIMSYYVNAALKKRYTINRFNKELESIYYLILQENGVHIRSNELTAEFIEEAKEILYDNLPTSPVIHGLYELMNAHGKGKQLALTSIEATETTLKGKKQGNRHKIIEYKQKKGELVITQTDNQTGDKITFQIKDNFQMRGKGVKKCVTFLLTKSLNQSNRTIGFELQDLVNNGMYSSVNNARAGIKNALDIMQGIQFSGEIRKGKRIIAQEGGVLWYHYSIKNNYVTVSVNDKMNIEFFAAYFALIPQYAYMLTSNSFDLCTYIFMLARQNADSIKEKGYFNISMKRICEYLSLPTPEPGKKFKAKQLVIEPIQKAIAEIIEKSKEQGYNDISIINYSEPYTTYEKWLAGYLQISFKGRIKERIEERTKKIIDKTD
jgi:hypothetical protein|nr:MAG TPA: PROTEIN/DNA Complex-DNA COMPLEX, DNA REPLICATION, REPLICATION-DNA.1A [Caudoviricetes sp.]